MTSKDNIGIGVFKVPSSMVYSQDLSLPNQMTRNQTTDRKKDMLNELFIHFIYELRHQY
jgi:hypothetical protein